jgi:hypothetical protein
VQKKCKMPLTKTPVSTFLPPRRKSGGRKSSRVRVKPQLKSPTESSKKIEKTVDGERMEARVTLPQVTAASQDSEWFCEHREGKCLRSDVSRHEAMLECLPKRTLFIDKLVL